MIKNSLLRYMKDTEKPHAPLHHASYSSLKPKVKPILREHRSTDKKRMKQIEIKSEVYPHLQLDARQKNSCYLTFIRKHKNEPKKEQLDIVTIIRISESSSRSRSYEDINLNILDCSNEELMIMSSQMLEKFGLAQPCGKFVLGRLIKEIHLGYNNVSYHNFAHGFSLMHMFYHLAKMDKKFKCLFTKE